MSARWRRFLALHPMPPLTTEDHFARNRLLRARRPRA